MQVNNYLEFISTYRSLITKFGGGDGDRTCMRATQIRAGNVIRWRCGRSGSIHERDAAVVAVRALSEDGHAGRNTSDGASI